jgi:hypothetical protein
MYDHHNNRCNVRRTCLTVPKLCRSSWPLHSLKEEGGCPIFLRPNGLHFSAFFGNLSSFYIGVFVAANSFGTVQFRSYDFEHSIFP